MMCDCKRSALNELPSQTIIPVGDQKRQRQHAKKECEYGIKHMRK